MSKSLKLVPHFTKKVAQIITKNESQKIAVNFTNLIKGLTIKDEQSPTIKVIIQGQEILGSIVYGGSGVNVVKKITCDRLGITKWEACPF